jgi:UPF0755 protein
MKRKFATLVICITVGCIAVGIFASWVRLPAGPVSVTIPPGASAKEVAVRLSRAGIISSPVLFLPALYLSGKTRNVKAGIYLIPPRSSILTVIRLLTRGKAQYIRVTIPEGYEARQIADVLAAQGVVRRDRFLQLVRERKCEGFLYPDTYFFEAYTPEEKVIERMEQTFRKHFTPELAARAGELRLSELQAVTLASIIEREAVRAEERPLISGVFHNRLRKHWYLESCATVQYALGKHKARLTFDDVQIKSPYNTYHVFGLPPGPICSPGIASIRAALYPAQTDAMFFVAKSSGTHTFSRYFSEHLRQKRQNRRNK